VASQIKHFATDIEKHAPFQTELACKLLIYQPRESEPGSHWDRTVPSWASWDRLCPAIVTVS